MEIALWLVVALLLVVVAGIAVIVWALVRQIGRGGRAARGTDQSVGSRSARP